MLMGGSVIEESAEAQENRGIDLGPAQEFKRFRLYYLGESFQGLPLTHVDREKAFGHPVWYFIYGDCQPPPDDPEQGCAFPLQVVNHTVCDRFPAVFYQRPKPFPFRGAKAARPSTAGSFDVYTGRTAAAVHSDDGRHLAQPAAALRRVGAQSVPPSLREPPEGSMRGKLRCQGRWRS
jgi:hypothetical protein